MKHIRFIGLDVHKERISVAVAEIWPETRSRRLSDKMRRERIATDARVGQFDHATLGPDVLADRKRLSDAKIHETRKDFVPEIRELTEVVDE